MKIFRFFTLLASIILITACGLWPSDGSEKKPPVDLSGIGSKNDITVPYKELGGVKVISVELNGEPMNMIYDTGCSGLHISLLELQTLYKNGKFSAEDIIGMTHAQIANGQLVENAVIIIKQVQIGDENGIILKNVQATVALNQEAPILLGNGVLDKLASVKVDNINKQIIFSKY